MAEVITISDAIIRLEQVTKLYKMDEIEVRALNGVDLSVDEGEFAAIIGPSGSGKSTMLHIIGCLDLPTSGRVFLEGTNISDLGDSQLARLRGKRIGFVFQFFNLYPTLSAIENVELPMMIQNMGVQERREKAEKLLESVGLLERKNHFPSQLSGGQKQRIAISRALANDPALILADEPTGNLDSESGKEILAIFEKLHKDGRTIVVVTHEDYVAEMAERTVRMKDGLLEDVK
ncbi:MAG: ABC transporter ATP-binding protein [Candidatus Hydrothermarchaeales archaeon]